MIVGILSDTHNNLKRTATAASILALQRCEAIFHCGDIGKEDVLWELAAGFPDPTPPIYCVIGNCDPEAIIWQGFTPKTGIHILGRFGEVTHAGKCFAIVHGDDTTRLHAALRSGKYDYVLTGHTHHPDTCQIANTLLINPGAVHRAAEPTVATMDTETNKVNHMLLSQ